MLVFCCDFLGTLCFLSGFGDPSIFLGHCPISSSSATWIPLLYWHCSRSQWLERVTLEPFSRRKVAWCNFLAVENALILTAAAFAIPHWVTLTTSVNGCLLQLTAERVKQQLFFQCLHLSLNTHHSFPIFPSYFWTNTIWLVTQTHSYTLCPQPVFPLTTLVSILSEQGTDTLETPVNLSPSDLRPTCHFLARDTWPLEYTCLEAKKLWKAQCFSS